MTITETDAARHTTGSPSERLTSRDAEAFEVPSGREEVWRFTPSRKLRDFFNGVDGDADATELKPQVPAPATVEFADETHELWGIAGQPSDRIAAVTWGKAQVAAAVRIPANAEIAEPVRLSVTGHAGKRGYGHLIIDAGSNSHATVIIDHVGGGEHSANVEIRLGDGASLDVITVQNWDADAFHLAHHDALVGRDASYRHINVTLGGGLVRLVPTVRFSGPGGSAELLGVNFAGDNQHFESRLYVDHGQPHCTSNVLYKNALDGDSARTVWIGDVRIRPAAKGTQTYEMNRNLVLSDGARADSVPNLEIETGDIAGAGHASATGRFDDLQLFYLQSRGIPEDAARRLVVRGFFADVIERIGLPELEHTIMASIEARLGYTGDDAETLTAELENDPS